MKKRKYKHEKNEASYKNQNDASDKGNEHTNNLYNAKIYNVLGCVGPRRPHWMS